MGHLSGLVGSLLIFFPLLKDIIFRLCSPVVDFIFILLLTSIGSFYLTQTDHIVLAKYKSVKDEII